MPERPAGIVVEVKEMDRDRALVDLRTAGWCVVEGVIPGDRVEGVRESVAAAAAVHGRPDVPEGIGFVPGLINVDQSFAPYLADPPVLGLVEALLGEHVRVSFTSAIVNYPGNRRGGWHADWPFNQNSAGRILAPYPDAVMHLTTLWMLSHFTPEDGGTFIVPGSHRANNNPTGNNGVDPNEPYPSEIQVTGEAGSVLVMDSRLWHATAPNRSGHPRVALAVRYAPWWLNLEVLRPGSEERARMVDETGATENVVPPVPRSVYRALPDEVKPLFRHWVSANEKGS